MKQNYVIVLSIVLVIGIVVYSLIFDTKGDSDQMTEKILLHSLESCFSNDDAGRFITNEECLRKIVPKILDATSTHTFMEYLIAPVTPKAVVYNCHVIAHTIGMESYNKATSLEDAIAGCSPSCGGGCTHGVVGAAALKEFGEQSIGEDIAHANFQSLRTLGEKYCTTTSMCHAFGHVTFLSTGDYKKSLELCDAVSESNRRNNCHRGVFMEISKDENSFSFLLSTTTIYSPDDPDSYPVCSLIPTEYQHTCFQFLTDRVFASIVSSDTTEHIQYATLKDFCEVLSSVTRSYCFEQVGYQIVNREEQKLCATLKTQEDRASCTFGRVQYLLFIGKDPMHAINYCGELTGGEEVDICYKAVFQNVDTKAKNGHTYTEAEKNNFYQQNDNPTLTMEQYKKYLFYKNELPDFMYGMYGEITRSKN